MRLVYLDHCARLSGAELALLRLLEARKASADDVTVVLAEDGPLRGRLVAAGARVEVVAMRERSRDLGRSKVVLGPALVVGAADALGYALRLRALIQKLDPDLVVTNSLKASLYGGVAARLSGRPVLWHVHDRIATDYMPALAVTLVRAAARVIPTAVVANSRATLDTLALSARSARRLGAAVVGNPLPSPLAARSPSPDRPPARDELTVGMVGRLAPWKGQHVFLRAFAAAFDPGEARAVIVGGSLFGEDAYRDELRDLAAALGIADRVRFTGQVDDPTEEMVGFDILVHASTSPEPFGQVIVEGMALSLAVVAADAGGPAEIVTPESTGLLYPPGDHEALARCLTRLGSSQQLRARLGAAAAVAARAFAPEQIADETERIYRRAAAARRPGLLRRRLARGADQMKSAKLRSWRSK